MGHTAQKDMNFDQSRKKLYLTVSTATLPTLVLAVG